MNCPVKKTFLIKTIMVLGLQTQVFAGQIYHVSPQNPNSFVRAVRRAGPGDTVILSGGTYRLGEVLIERRKGMGGANGHYLTIKAAPGEEPVLRGRRRFIIKADYVRVEGLHFVMPWRLEAFGTGLQIVNNKFTGPQPKYGAIEVGGRDVLIEGNFIKYSDIAGNTRDHGIYVHKGERITLRNNTIIGTKGYGIHVFDEQKSAKPRDWAAHPFAIKDYVLENNFVSGSQSRSGIIIAKGRGGRHIKLENITIRNNILVGNAEFGLYIRQGKNITVYNNTFYNNRSTAFFVKEPAKGSEPVSHVTIKNNIFIGRAHVRNKSTGQSIVLENNLYNTGPRLQGITDAKQRVGDPRFVDTEAYDFRLQKSSPAIDAGIHVGLPFTGSAPDLGALEFGSSAPKWNSLQRLAAKSAKPISTILTSQDTPKTELGSGKGTAYGTSDAKTHAVKGGLISFKAYIANKTVILNWQTTSGSGHRGFDIERRGIGTDFVKVGFVKANAASTSKQGHIYQYLDEGLQPGTYAYRLKQVQQNGSFELLAIVKINTN